MRDADTDRGRWAADGFYGFCLRQRRHVRDGEAKRESAQLEKKPRQPMKHKRCRYLQHQRA